MRLLIAILILSCALTACAKPKGFMRYPGISKQSLAVFQESIPAGIGYKDLGLVSGEGSYNDNMPACKAEAIKDLVARAQNRGANAVVEINFEEGAGLTCTFQGRAVLMSHVPEK